MNQFLSLRAFADHGNWSSIGAVMSALGAGRLRVSANIGGARLAIRVRNREDGLVVCYPCAESLRRLGVLYRAGFGKSSSPAPA